MGSLDGEDRLVRGIWDKIKDYFSTSEAWGSPHRISGLLLLSLYEIRCASSWPIIIHCGTQGKHCENSFHYKGMAVDFHFGINIVEFEKQASYLQDFLGKMQMADFVGLGVYPEWNHPGFHLDVRGWRAKWAKINGNYASLEG